VYLFGNQSSTEFGNSVGGTTFEIFNNDPNFPQLPATSIAPGTFNGAPMVTQLDPDININLSNSTQHAVPTLSETNFSVKWTGQVLADTTGSYTFTTQSDDGIRVTIDGQEIINDWSEHADTSDSGSISLTGGQRYDIEVDYYQGGGGAVAQLNWAGPNFSETLVDSSHLFMSDAATSPGGLLGQYWGTIDVAEPGYDTVIRDLTGIGGERYEIDDATQPAAAEAYLDPLIDVDEESYLPFDTVRDRELLISFPNLNATDPAQAAGVTAVAAHYKGIVMNFEGLNEPNNSYDGASYVPQEAAFYAAVKAGDPQANVVGPAIVSLGAFCVNWCNSFFSAGGAQYINAFSFHAYNVENGDLQLTMESLQGLKQMLAGWGLSNLPLWQTEQGYAAVNNGLYQPQLQGRWTMLQMVAFDQFNIPKEHNYYWYDASQGDWPWPMWWENDDGSLNPAGALMRVFSEEVYGTNFASAYDFGADGNNLYLGSLYSGPGKNVGVFMTADQETGDVMLQVTGGSSIHVISPFGVASDLPVINGYVDLPVTNVPNYVEIAAGQTISVVPQNWGPDLAEQSGVTINSSNPGNGTSRLNDGVFQNWFWTQNDAGIPFTFPFDNSTPATIEFDLPLVQTVDKVVVFSGAPWELTGALMDFDVQYNNNGTWTTLEHVTEDPKTFAVWTPTMKTNADEYYNEQANFEVAFPPVQTSAVRLVINKCSYGGVSSLLAEQAGGQSSPTPTLDIREVQIFGQ
jgi:hypothetical protein